MRKDIVDKHLLAYSSCWNCIFSGPIVQDKINYKILPTTKFDETRRSKEALAGSLLSKLKFYSIKFKYFQICFVYEKFSESRYYSARTNFLIELHSQLLHIYHFGWIAIILNHSKFISKPNNFREKRAFY